MVVITSSHEFSRGRLRSNYNHFFRDGDGNYLPTAGSAGGDCGDGDRGLVRCAHLFCAEELSPRSFPKSGQVAIGLCTVCVSQYILFVLFSFFMGHLPTLAKYGKTEGNRFYAVLEW